METLVQINISFFNEDKTHFDVDIMEYVKNTELMFNEPSPEDANGDVYPKWSKVNSDCKYCTSTKELEDFVYEYMLDAYKGNPKLKLQIMDR